MFSLLWDPWDLHVPESVFVFFILCFLLLLTFFLSFVFPFFLFFLWVILFGRFRYHVFERHNTLYNMIALHWRYKDTQGIFNSTCTHNVLHVLNKCCTYKLVNINTIKCCINLIIKKSFLIQYSFLSACFHYGKLECNDHATWEDWFTAYCYVKVKRINTYCLSKRFIFQQWHAAQQKVTWFGILGNSGKKWIICYIYLRNDFVYWFQNSKKKGNDCLLVRGQRSHKQRL